MVQQWEPAWPTGIRIGTSIAALPGGPRPENADTCPGALQPVPALFRAMQRTGCRKFECYR